MKESNDVTMVATWISKEDVSRLDHIIKEYGFKSRYQIIKTIIEAFLKTADPKPEEVVNNDIEEMFDGMDMPSNVDFQGTKSKYRI